MGDFVFEGDNKTKGENDFSKYDSVVIDNNQSKIDSESQFNGDIVIEGTSVGVYNNTYTDRRGNAKEFRPERLNRPSKPLGCCLVVVILMFLFPFILGILGFTVLSFLF